MPYRPPDALLCTSPTIAFQCEQESVEKECKNIHKIVVPDDRRMRKQENKHASKLISK